MDSKTKVQIIIIFSVFGLGLLGLLGYEINAFMQQQEKNQKQKENFQKIRQFEIKSTNTAADTDTLQHDSTTVN